VDLSHVSATPIGLIVAASVRLVQIEARRLRFEVECRDEVDAISRGFHERSIIVKEKFLDRIKRKASAFGRDFVTTLNQQSASIYIDDGTCYEAAGC
jgi:fluoroacetyl-CoA thioesterase